MEDRGDLTLGGLQTGHHLGGAELQGGAHPGDVDSVAPGEWGDDAVDGASIPAGRCELFHEGTGLCLHPVGFLPGDGDVLLVLRQAEGDAQPRYSVGAAPEDLVGTQDRQHQVDHALTLGNLREHVEAVADLDVLDLTQPAVNVHHELVEGILVGAFLESEVLVHLGGLDELPDLALQRGSLRRVHHGDVAVLVEQLLQPGDVAVGLGTCHRWDEVVDDRGMGTPLGLRALTGIVDEERVDQRQVAQGRIRARDGIEGQGFAGQPLEIAVLADVDDGVRPELLLQPAVGGQVVVAGRQVRVVVDRDRVLPETTGRLHEDHDVARLQGCGDDLAVRVGGAIHEQIAGGLTPGLSHLLPQLGGKFREPATIGGGVDTDGLTAQLLAGQPFLVLPAGRDDGVDEGVARCGVRMFALHRLQLAGARDLAGGPQVVARLPHGAQQPDDRDGGVETDRVADPGVLGGIGRQDDGDPPFGGRDQSQSRVIDGQRGDPGAAFRIGDVVGQAVGIDLLEGEGDGDQPPVELGNRHLGGDVVGAHTIVGGLPGLPAPGQGQALQDRDVQFGELLHVPGALVTAGGSVGGGETTRGLHGGDDGVTGAQVFDQSRVGVAQRCGLDRNGQPTRRVDGIGKSDDVGDVAGRVMGPVEDDADPGAAMPCGLVGGGIGPGQFTPDGHHRDRFEGVTRQQNGVGEEGVHVAKIVETTLHEIGMGLRRDPHRHGGELHQCGVGGVLTTENHQRQPRFNARGEGLGQLFPAAEETEHDQLRAVDQFLHRVDVEFHGIAVHVVGLARACAEQVGLGGGEQCDSGQGVLRQDPRPGG